MTMAATAPAFTYRHSGTRTGRFPAEEAVLVVDDWMVFLDRSLNRWEVYVDGINRRTFVNPATWASFDGETEVAFERDFVDAYADRRVREMRFICLDAGPYGEAARKQAASEGTDVVRGKDRITDLMERAAGLIVQAASLNASPSEAQLQVFAVRHATIASDLQELEADLAKLRSQVSLAGAALVDASST